MVNFSFRGLMAPTFTAFNSDLSLNINIIPQYAKYLSDNGIEGILVNGTSGEGMSLSLSERKQTAEAWVEAVKSTKQHLMVQIGGCPLPDVLELAKHAEDIGVASLLCLPELYFKPANSAELIEYLKLVGSKAPKTPLLYYHIPSFTNVNIHMGTFLNEAIGKIPTFCGIKFTSTLLDEGVEAIRANNGKFAVFLGADQIMAGAYALGFDSVIATSLNIFPKINIEIKKYVESCDLQKAKESQNKLNDAISIITKNGKWVPTMKTAMNLVTPLNVGVVRKPLTGLKEDQISEMKSGLENL